MRILLISDIHANRAALEAINEPFDVCLFLGDLVDYGVEPEPCIAWVRQHAKYAIRGNHDHGVAQKVSVTGVNGFRYLTGVTRDISLDRVNETDRKYLASLPTTLAFTLNNKRFFLVHATPRDPLDEFAPSDAEFWKRRLEGIEADYVCVGHTHAQLILHVGKTTVINPGSVGLPRDGDPRAGYAIITDEGPILKRIEYPIHETITAVQATAMPEHAKELLTDILTKGKLDRKTGLVAGQDHEGETPTDAST